MLTNFLGVYKLPEDLSNKKPKRKLCKFFNRRVFFPEQLQNVAQKQGNNTMQNNLIKKWVLIYERKWQKQEFCIVGPKSVCNFCSFSAFFSSTWTSFNFNAWISSVDFLFNISLVLLMFMFFLQECCYSLTQLETKWLLVRWNRDMKSHCCTVDASVKIHY